MLQVVNPYGDWYTGRWYSFDDVTQIDFRFRQLVMWSSPDGHDASSYQIWWKNLIQTGVVHILPKFKMAAAAILYFQVM